MEQFVKKTIKQAGSAIMKFYGSRDIEHHKETRRDIVTKADLASQKIIVEGIRKNYPGHGIISEESESFQSKAEYIWYIDPLDGTRNFASNVPLFGINMGLARNSKLILGAIYLPSTKEFCFAKKNCGVYLNDKRIRCSNQSEWELSYGIVSTHSYKLKYKKFFSGLAKISSGKAWINAIASPAVSAVFMADGRRDWYASRGNKVWDYAAPSIIMQEAGCVVTNPKGSPWKLGDDSIVVANKSLHPEFLKIFQ